MQTFDFKGIALSRLGFGAMRLPLHEDGSIDQAATQQLIDYAIEHGVNYFDTAYPYHNGYSEIVLARCLAKHPRASYHLATKFPGHQIQQSFEPDVIFEDQLAKCQTDSFDFYLLHNIYEGSLATYRDERWGIIDYLVQQKRNGRIKHLGFSAHGSVEVMREFLEFAGQHMEFCQIQLNYLDWTLQDAQGKCALLDEAGLPIWVMEPVRGGKLANLDEKDHARLQQRRPDESDAAWAMRWLVNRASDNGIGVILSGMSSLDQVADNVATFEGGQPLTAAEEQLLLDIAEGLKDTVPCTACRYCCDSCPQGLDIPALLDHYNDMRTAPSFTPAMAVEALPPEKRPDACLGCGACSAMCPQGIDIPAALADLASMLAKMPSWAESSRQREEQARKMREGLA